MTASKIKIKLKKDDTVRVMAGKDRGKEGKIIELVRRGDGKDRVIVAGINIVKKARKQRKQNERGGIQELEAPLAISNVQILCRRCGPTRLGYKVTGSGKDQSRQRVCRKCGEVV